MFLKNIRVEYISLVRKGANKKAIIWKSGDADPSRRWEIPIAKTNEEKRLVYGIVYSPGEMDSQGDYTDAEQIEKAAHLFMKGARTATGVDRHHSFQPEDGAFVAESWIVKSGDPVFPDEPEGSWAVGIRIEDDDLWSEVKKGEIGGLSMGGVADLIQKDDGNERSILSQIKRLLKGASMDEKQVKKIAKEAVDEAIKGIEQPITKDDVVGIVTEAMKGVIDPITDRLKKIEKQSPGSSQDGDGNPGDVDYTAIGAKIAKAVMEG